MGIMKKVIKETWLDFFTIFLVVSIGLLIAYIINWDLFFIPIVLGLFLGSKPYVKIRLIMEEK